MHPSVRALLRSKAWKWVTVVLGLSFLLYTFLFVARDPAPFLRFGYAGVFVFNLVGPGMFLIPFLAQQMNVPLLAFVSALGMAANDSVSWMVGKNGDVVLPRGKRVIRIEALIVKYGAFALFFWALIPFPYDLIGLIAGYLQVPYRMFVLATFLGRLVRFLLIGFGTVAVAGSLQ